MAATPSRLRNSAARYWQARRSLHTPASRQSRYGLDWTNFFIADVQTGFGTFVAFYLAHLGWAKSDVGIALTTGTLAAVIMQIPGGALADAVSWKRGLAAIGIVTIGISAVLLAVYPTFYAVFTAEILHGVTAGIAGSSIVAISLGLSKRHAASARISRNLRWAAAGNAVTAAVMGLCGGYFQSGAIFYAAAALCIPALIGLWLIRADEIDYLRARNATRKDHSFTLERVVNVAKNRQLLLFALCLVLFHFSNASLLPLVGENLGAAEGAGNLLMMSTMVMVPQIVVAILAPWVGYWSELWGRKPLLLMGFGCEMLRAALFIFIANPAVLVVGQLLDGVTGATITLLTTLVIADLTTGTGRLNLTYGVVGTATGLAAAMSTAVTGFIAHRFGDTVSFSALGAVTAIGLIALWTLFRETRPEKYLD
jgi:MFS family permease